jgi:CDP-diglyceride synthetase
MGEGQERHRQRSKGEPDSSLFDASSEPQPADEIDEDLTLSLDGTIIGEQPTADQDRDPTLSLDSKALAREGDSDKADSSTVEDDLTLELPGWREPPTGEIPRIIEELAGEPLPPMHGNAPGSFDALEGESRIVHPQERRAQPAEEKDDFLIPIEREAADDETLDSIRSVSGWLGPAADDDSAGASGGDIQDQQDQDQQDQDQQDQINVRQAHLDERRGSQRSVVRESSRSNGAENRDAIETRDAPSQNSDTANVSEEPIAEAIRSRRSRHEVVSSRSRSQKRARGTADRFRSTVRPDDGDNSSLLEGLEERTVHTGRPTERVKVVRTVTGIVLAIVLLLALKLGTVSTLVVVVVAVTTAAAEGYNLLRRGGYRPAALVGLLAVIALVLGAYLSGEDAIVLVIVAAILLSLIWFMVQHRGEQFVAGITTTMVMVVWVGLFGSFAGLMLRQSLFGVGGLGLLVGTLLCTTTADVFAFFGGSLFGKHKLAPAISPGKTIEGVLIGGLATVLVGGLVLPLIHPFTLTAGILIGIAVAIVAPVGDLAESALKRSVSVKDSSRLLPGHGGMLDRIDGILMVLPVAFYLFLSLHLR